MTTNGAPTLLGPITIVGAPTPPAPVTPAPPPTAVFVPELMTTTLWDLVTAVQGLQLHMAGPYAPPMAVPIAAYGHPALPWPSQGAPSLLPFQAGPRRPRPLGGTCSHPPPRPPMPPPTPATDATTTGAAPA